MARRRGGKKELEGALGLKISTPRSIPTFQKTEQCASERYGVGESLAEPEATEVKVAPLRLQWSQL